MEDRPYWGDLHAHCAVSYGRGTVPRALAAAREQLDFATVTGHATWHDMPSDRDRYGEVIDYHRHGFARLHANWEALQSELARHHQDGRFATFLSYEWHSTRWGDRHVVYPGAYGPILDADHPRALAAAVAPHGGLPIPHHPGYGPHARGIDWDGFDAADSPVVEMVSSHGSSEDDEGPLPIHHTMGPRTREGTVAHGLAIGHRFGLIGGTDHHGGHPGHYGAGRTAVLAPRLTRDAIMDALRARHCYAATGDKIILTFTVNDAPMGSELRSGGARRIRVDVRGCDAIDRVEVIKNGRFLRRRFGPVAPRTLPGRLRAKLRLEWGWGEKGVPARWQGRAVLTGGEIVSVEPTFRGEEVLDPRDERSGAPDDQLMHRITERSDRSVGWRSLTFGNPHPSVPSTSGVILEIDADADAVLTAQVNDRTVHVPLRDAFVGARRTTMRGFLSEAFLVHRLVPASQWTDGFELLDRPEEEVDVYRVRVTQRNGQMAWSSPIWVEE